MHFIRDADLRKILFYSSRQIRFFAILSQNMEKAGTRPREKERGGDSATIVELDR